MYHGCELSSRAKFGNTVASRGAAGPGLWRARCRGAQRLGLLDRNQRGRVVSGHWLHAGASQPRSMCMRKIPLTRMCLGPSMQLLLACHCGLPISKRNEASLLALLLQALANIVDVRTGEAVMSLKGHTDTIR